MSADPGREGGDRAHDALSPSPWIVRFAGLVPPGARVLDVAAGSGRHARFFAQRGCRVLAVDRDADALRALDGVAGVATRAIDLETGAQPFSGETFDAIVVTNYLHRPLFADLFAALAGDGVFLCETFAAGNAAFGRPSRPEFLLEEGELVDRVRGNLVVIAFEQGIVDRGEHRAVVQRVAAVGRARARPLPLRANHAEADRIR